MLKHKRLSMAVAGALALAGASTANAGIGFKAGEWDIDFSGNVNGFATYNDCATMAVVGNDRRRLACGDQPPDTSRARPASNPAYCRARWCSRPSRRQMNMDVGVTIGLYPTTPHRRSRQRRLGQHQQVRWQCQPQYPQNFLTFGDASWGNVKIGRDIGLFGSDAILSDMTLLGVGSGAAFLGGVTTLGRIGVGYIYADWIPQITYTSPGFSASRSRAACSRRSTPSARSRAPTATVRT